ncbi:MAG: DEAD/DEAH box helicase family protein [Bacteroidales bacterium]|nr:DEAD/DEAH box helicase family protein [Bacteroidales bacterium]
MKETVKLRYKVQQHQTEAVDSTCDVFEGQPKIVGNGFEITGVKDEDRLVDVTGYGNAEILLNRKELLANIQKIQLRNGLPKSKKLSDGVAPVNLDVEMETGTGKTYVYIKTMLELNRRYGWSKFVVVVPSIAIREGVAESFQLLNDHFYEQYHTSIISYVYDSERLYDISNYSNNSDVSCLIINSQAFTKLTLRIYTDRDSLQSRVPMEVIAANRPIIILDEPQRLGGPATKQGIKEFKPLFAINYSATHKVKHDCIFALDALDAFNRRLVKQISPIGHKTENPVPTAYISVKSIIADKKRVKVKLETLKKLAGEKKTITFQVKNYEVSANLEEETKLPSVYEGFSIADISPLHQTVRFANDVTLRVGQIIGDDNSRSEIQRVQIRNTIKAHLDKERGLFRRGIKCISLFFIDFVSNYRIYDSDGNAQNGPLAKIFEEEYSDLIAEELTSGDDVYNEYLKQFTPQSTHTGYFSIDKNKKAVNTASDKDGNSEDKEAYDRILKDKGWLLSMTPDSPRFIFSHSALREGWDNPNVFQICMLRNSANETSRRQEVGRGLRICVDKNGVRQDADLLGDDFFEVNELTVIANEEYKDFVEGLQNEIMRNLRERPAKLDEAYLKQFIGKSLKTNEGGEREITDDDIIALRHYLNSNQYVNKETKEPTPIYRAASADNSLKPMPEDIADLSESFKRIVDAVNDKNALAKLMRDISKRQKTEINKLNRNFTSAEFQELWNTINRKYIYTVHYSSDDLIRNAASYLNEKLNVPRQLIVTERGQQATDDSGNLFFQSIASEPEQTYLRSRTVSDGLYDVVGRIAVGAKLTRSTVVKILKKLEAPKIEMFAINPEVFISQAIRLIRAEKARLIVKNIQYKPTNQSFDSGIFTLKPKAELTKALRAKKHISDYVFFDSDVEKSFAERMEHANEVVVYAKLPRTFWIPTPVGDYSPDWAIAFETCGVKHIYFVSETKGTTDDDQQRPVEEDKITCAYMLYNEQSGGEVRYRAVSSYDALRNEMIDYVEGLIAK